MSGSGGSWPGFCASAIYWTDLPEGVVASALHPADSGFPASRGLSGAVFVDDGVLVASVVVVIVVVDEEIDVVVVEANRHLHPHHLSAEA